MTATDELRALLDEHGVKWEKGASLTSMYTYWTDCNGHDVTAVGTNNVMFMSHFVTPSQAIDATLRREECEDIGTDRFVCSKCGCTLDIEDAASCEPTMWVDGVAACPRFCPNCGRKVR